MTRLAFTLALLCRVLPAYQWLTGPAPQPDAFHYSGRLAKAQRAGDKIPMALSSASQGEFIARLLASVGRQVILKFKRHGNLDRDRTPSGNQVDSVVANDLVIVMPITY